MALALLSVGASLVGSVVAAQGAMSAANAQAEAANRQAAITERNRVITLQQTEAQQEDKRAENRRALSSIRASYGASGIDMAGSPLDVLEDSALEQELDVSRMGYEGQLKSIGMSETAESYRMEAKAAKTAGKYAATGAILSGVASAGNTLYQSGSFGGGR